MAGGMFYTRERERLLMFLGLHNKNDLLTYEISTSEIAIMTKSAN